jgi:hypothetical protein
MTVKFPVEGSYRCAECKTWKHLKSYADAIVDGPLGPDGKVTDYEFVEDYQLQEGSIRCTEHIDALIEWYWKGEWRRFWLCPRCHGRGKINGPGSSREWDCGAGLKIETLLWGGLHDGWLPASRHPDWNWERGGAPASVDGPHGDDQRARAGRL